MHGTSRTAQTVHHRDGVRTVCASCGETGPGVHPAGWLIFPKYGRDARGTQIAVGEIPFCPDCRRAGRIRWPS